MSKAIRDYASERDAAFAAFVDDGNFSHIDSLIDKWGGKRIPHDDVGRAAVYKAVQECVGISEEVKTRAFLKCIDLGFLPWIGE